MDRITNSEVKRSAAQIFAYGPLYETPFYNREVSKKEIAQAFTDVTKGKPLAYFISEPLGTGKTFFIDHMSSRLGIKGREKPFYVKYITKEELNRSAGDVIFVDEADIKSSWNDLAKGLKCIKEHMEETGQKVIILGDYCLRNKELYDIFKKYNYLHNFEALDRKFLNGVINQRIKYYMGKNVKSIISEELFSILTPEGLAVISSFRAILTFLAQLVRRIPANNEECLLTLDIATEWVKDEFDPLLDSDKQAEFLKLFQCFISQNHPKGKGLNGGLTTDELFFRIGKDAGFKDINEFEDEIIRPFTSNELLISKGIPYYSKEKKEFIRRPEPFLPSIQMLLLSEC